MAAYAALVSVTHIIEQIQHHPHPPITLDEKQVLSLFEKITFLQDYVECYSGSKETETLIADAAYAAEDVIESHIVNQILDGEINSTEFRKDLQKVIEDMDFLVLEIKENRMNIHDRRIMYRSSITVSSSLKSTQNVMVGNDDVLNEILEKLTGHQSSHQIIPIVGMGGIGKTTLAANVYVNPLIAQHFDILAWVTISQDYIVQEILVELLLCLKKSKESLSGMNENELGENLHKTLSGRRYLIVMDDLWNIEAWDSVTLFLPDNNNSSRILVTTRLSNVAYLLSSDSDIINMNFLDEVHSWNLLCKIVFGEAADCPIELEKLGKTIVRNCKGLPLSVVVIGGLLSKSVRSQEYWEYISENINSNILNLEDNELSLKILWKSYDELPVHLKPCFLYMGVFPEDRAIRVPLLIKLWTAEGFLKPIRGKKLEVVAEEYLKDLIDRNLILVGKCGIGGKIKSCTIHDLLRDLCLREAQETEFLCVTRQHGADHVIPRAGTNSNRRVAIHQSPKYNDLRDEIPVSQSVSSLTRALICNSPRFNSSLNLRLLRVLKADNRILHYSDLHSIEAIFQLVNSRYIGFGVDWLRISGYLSSIHLLWNLQTLVIYGTWEAVAPPEIWTMPFLKHVKFDLLELSDPPVGDELFVLENLQQLSGIKNFKCGQQVVMRIPNVMKLRLYYQGFEGLSGYCLNNLGLLHKLESLYCGFQLDEIPSRSDFLQSLVFPHSLKKLILEGARLHWEDVTTKIGSLPFLQVLKLKGSLQGSEWETVEGQFSCLKFLSIDSCDALEYWTTDSSHFPLLQHLVLRSLENFREIPWSIGDIPTLQLMELYLCRGSVVVSAKEILLELYTTDLL